MFVFHQFSPDPRFGSANDSLSQISAVVCTKGKEIQSTIQLQRRIMTMSCLVCAVCRLFLPRSESLVSFMLGDGQTLQMSTRTRAVNLSSLKVAIYV